PRSSGTPSNCNREPAPAARASPPRTAPRRNGIRRRPSFLASATNPIGKQPAHRSPAAAVSAVCRGIIVLRDRLTGKRKAVVAGLLQLLPRRGVAGTGMAVAAQDPWL